MTVIRATCSDCGRIELRSRDIVVRLCLDTDEQQYYFLCPVCRMVEAQLTQTEVVDSLLVAGCRLESWSLPDELSDSKRYDSGKLTHDDALDFHHAILARNELAGSDELAEY